ncbi:MAG: GIY-YIG nuclease family protein [Candidatus Omnitrophota bacterium]
MSKWTVYILKCNDASLYTGITTDLEKRVKKHNEGRAAKYTRAKRPVSVVYTEGAVNSSSAKKREAEIKKLSRQAKVELIK